MDKRMIMICGGCLAGLAGLLFFDNSLKGKAKKRIEMIKKEKNEKKESMEKSVSEKLENISNKISDLYVTEIRPKKEVKKVEKKVDKEVKTVVAVN